MSRMESRTLKQPLTEEEKKLYGQLFTSLDPEGLGVVTGEKARDTFEKSNLAPSTLGEIWSIADPDNNGFLTQFGFCVAMRLIGHVQAGHHVTDEEAQMIGPLPHFSQLPTLKADNTSSMKLTSMVPPLRSEDAVKYGTLFSRTAPSGFLSGQQARGIFLKAKLAPAILGEIWTLVDRDNSGSLTKPEFIVAMHLIQGYLAGTVKGLPQIVAPAIWQAASGVSEKPQSGWFVSPEMKSQFERTFESLDSSRSGKLGASQVANFLMSSKLSQETLATIWDLADIRNNGEFGKQEFSIALFLVNKKIGGEELPSVVPDELIESTESTSVSSGQINQPAPPARTGSSSLNDLASLNDLFSSPVMSPEPTKVSRDSTGRGFVPSSQFGQQLKSEPAQPPYPNQTPQVPQPPQPHQVPQIPQPRQPNPATQPHPASSQPGGFSRSAQAQLHLPNQAGVNQAGANPEVASPSLLDDSDESETPEDPTKRFIPPVPTRDQKPSFSPNYEALRAMNNDLLADKEVSSQLSSANTDIANVSTQINSLTSQTEGLNEKKERAAAELQRIQTMKQEVEAKLTKLRALFEKEVEQVKEVESVLRASTEETGKLQQEASLAEANYHSEQAKLQELQLKFEASQKENQSFKEKLGVLNAENIDMRSQFEELTKAYKQSCNKVSVMQGQLSSSQEQSQGLKNSISQLLEQIRTTDLEASQLQTRNEEVEKSLPHLQKERADLEKKLQDSRSDLTEKTLSKSITTNSSEKTLPTRSCNPFYSQPPPFAFQDQFSESDSTNLPTVETEMSTPPDSEFRFTQNSLPPFSMNRPESLSSSVQNNAANSVRNDDTSQPDSPSTIPEETASPTEVLSRERNQLSSGVESFEMVNPNESQYSLNRGQIDDDDLYETSSQPLDRGSHPSKEAFPKSPVGESRKEITREEPQEVPREEVQEIPREEVQAIPQEITPEGIPSDEALPQSVPSHPSTNVVEQPETKELGFNESSKSEPTEEQVSKKLERTSLDPSHPSNTVDHSSTFENTPAQEMPHQEFPPIQELGSDSSSSDEEFHDSTLPQAKTEPENEPFKDEFDELEEAKEEAPGEEFPEEKFQEDQFFGFENPKQATSSSSDEWEQLFAGFGNSGTPQEGVLNIGQETMPTAVSQPHHTPSQTNDDAVEELCGMGFDRQSVLDALTRENWNLEAASNYLLDNA